MPEHSRIFAPADDLIAHMIAEPRILAHLFELHHGDTPIEPPRKGLLVVRVPDEWWMSGGAIRRLGPGVVEIGVDLPPDESPWARLPGDPCPSFMNHPELRDRFRWFSDVAPPSALVRWLSAAASTTGEPCAYYHHREHGDDAYYEFAILFSGSLEPSLVINQTFLVDTDDDEQCVLLSPDGRSTFEGSVFSTVLEHIGSTSRLACFPPDDSSAFDWEIHRVDPRELGAG